MWIENGTEPGKFAFHALTHLEACAKPGELGGKCVGGRHVWSEDAIQWHSNASHRAIQSQVRMQDGQTLVLTRRERPQLVLNDEGRPAALFSGVSLLPYHTEPSAKHPDRTWILAQGVNQQR
jgi:hypothetical protein